MIICPDPDARNTDRYRLDLSFRAAADAAHAAAMEFSQTLQLLKAPVPADWVPEEEPMLVHTTCSAVNDY